MTGSQTEDRVLALVRDLQPVRRIPRIRSAVCVAVLIALCSATALDAMTGGTLPELARFRDDLGYFCILAGLLVLTFGALVAALALAVPGRERTTAIGLAMASGGLALSFVAALVACVVGESAGSRAALAGSWPCIGKATLLAAGPVGVGLAFVLHAASHRPRASTALALAGGVALGAALVHVTCSAGDPMHWLMGHVLPPVGVALALTVPVGELLAVMRRRNDRMSASACDAGTRR